MGNSFVDELSEQLSPIYRELQDLNIAVLGTQVELLRIAVGEADVFGDAEEDLITYVIGKAIVKHPWSSEMQLFGSTDARGVDITTALDLWDVLPIEVRIPFRGDESDSAINIKENDILVEILKDENKNKIPLYLQVTKETGVFNIRNLIGKKWICCLYRGELSDKMKSAVETYMARIK